MIVLFPDAFLPALLAAGEKAGTLCVTLLASYSVWLGFMQVMTDCSLTDKFSRLLTPLSKKLFATEDKAALEAITMNLAANILGLGGVATPYGVKAASLLEKQPRARYAHAMLFVVAATSLQLIPTTALSLLTLYGSQNPAFIVLPSLAASALSTLLGVILVKLLVKK